jgi:hypothetical protein
MAARGHRVAVPTTEWQALATKWLSSSRLHGASLNFQFTTITSILLKHSMNHEETSRQNASSLAGSTFCGQPGRAPGRLVVTIITARHFARETI